MNNIDRILYEDVKLCKNRIDGLTKILETNKEFRTIAFDEAMDIIIPKLKVEVKYSILDKKIIKMKYPKFEESEFTKQWLQIPLRLNKDITISGIYVYDTIYDSLVTQLAVDGKLLSSVIAGVYTTISVDINIYPEPNFIEKLFIADTSRHIQRQVIRNVSLQP